MDYARGKARASTTCPMERVVPALFSSNRHVLGATLIDFFSRFCDSFIFGRPGVRFSAVIWK